MGKEIIEERTKMEKIQQELDQIWPGWKMENLIGEGAFGKVYKITREEFGHTYKAALKVITIPQKQSEITLAMNDGMDEESAKEYFRSVVEDIVEEFALMSKFKGNSNIVSYEDHKVIPHQDGIGWNIYIRMELLTPLFQYLKENTLFVRDVIQMGIDICKALEMCQKYNIIHRDIKPENMFVSDFGQYKLGDFGIARQMEKTSSGMSKKGTYTYMAPEVYKGESYNATVDIYSLGIVLYRFLNNNRAPFFPPYPQVIRYSNKEKANIKRMSGVQMPIPEKAEGRLAEIVLKACAYQPEERYQTAEELKKALKEILEDNRNVEYKHTVVNPEKSLILEEPKYVSSSNENSNKTAEEVSSEKSVVEPQFESEHTIQLSEEEQKKIITDTQKKTEEQPLETEEVEAVAEEETEEVEVEVVAEADTKRKKVMAIMVLLVLILAGIIGYVSLRKVTVPSVVHLSMNEAEKIAEEASLRIIEKERQYSETVEKGEIISQFPKKGEKIRNGKEIEVIVSKGKKIKVPSIVRMSQKEAREVLKKMGLVLEVSKSEYSLTLKKGNIISQTPKDGDTVGEGDTIKVIVSKGPRQVKVPDVENKKLEKAKKILKEAKLRCKVIHRYSGVVSKGRVIYQSVEKGKKVDENSKITICISLGKEPVQENTELDDRKGTTRYTKPKDYTQPGNDEYEWIEDDEEIDDEYEWEESEDIQ